MRHLWHRARFSDNRVCDNGNINILLVIVALGEYRSLPKRHI